MSFQIEQFYAQLDEHFQRHDNAATEKFLMRSKESAAKLSEVSGPDSGCPSCCVEAPEVNLEFAAVCNELGCFYRSLSRWESAVAVFEEGLDELRRFFRDETPNAAMILMNLADTYRLMGDPNHALDLFRQAERIFVKNEMDGQPPMAGLYNNLALVYQAQGKPEQAVECIERSVSILQGVAGAAADLGAALQNLAAAYAALGRQEEADDAISASLALLSSQDCSITPHYPTALNTKGVFAFQAGNFETAARCFILALEKTEQLYGKNAQYAAGCRNCAEVCRRLGQLEKAAEYEAEAQALAEKFGL